MRPPDEPHVTFLTSSLGMGGAEYHIELIARALMERGIGLRVVCVEAAGPRQDALAALHAEVTRLEAGDRWWLHPVRLVRRVAADLRSSGTDVVMTNGYSAEVVGRLAAWIARVPVIQWKHNIGHLGRFGLRDRWTEWLLRPLDSRVLAVSRAQVGYLTDYLQIPSRRIGCVRNVLPPGRTSVPTSVPWEGGQVVICVAALRKEKDHPTLLRAFADVVVRFPAARLQLVGDGPERERIEGLAQELGIGESVTLLGNRADVDVLLARATVFVLPSYAVENLPFSVLEAMSAGLPVVTTDVGALSELVLDGVTGVLVPPRSPERLAAGLLDVLAEPARAAEMGAAGRRRLDAEFTFDEFAAALDTEVRARVTSNR